MWSMGRKILSVVGRPTQFIWSISQLRFNLTLCVVAATIPSVGCDPVRTTQQTVRLTVFVGDPNSPIVNAHVLLKDDFDGRNHIYPDTASQEEWHKHARSNWEQSDWFSGETNEAGEAVINITYTAIDGTRGNRTPPANRDWVTGKSFLVKLHDEQVSVMMTNGTVVAGNTFGVRVEDVSNPKYVPTQ